MATYEEIQKMRQQRLEQNKPSKKEKPDVLEEAKAEAVAKQKIINKRLNWTLLSLFVTIVLIILAASTLVVVFKNETAVISQKNILGTGVFYKIPVIDDAVYFYTNIQNKKLDKVKIYSFNGDAAKVTVNINYQLDKSRLVDITSKYETEEKFLNNLFSPEINLIIENTFGSISTAKLIQERSKANDQLKQNLQDIFKNMGVNLISVEIEHVDFIQDNCCNLTQK